MKDYSTSGSKRTKDLTISKEAKVHMNIHANKGTYKSEASLRGDQKGTAG